MSKFDDFLKEEEPEVDNLQRLDGGNYGCQSCDEIVPTAWFDEQSGEIAWYCSQKHRSVIRIGG